MNIKNKIIKIGTKVISKIPPKVIAKGPTIGTIIGVVGVVGSSIWACYNTTKINDITEQEVKMREHIEELKNEGMGEFGEYTVDEYKQDITLYYIDVIKNRIKLYIGPSFVGLISISAIIGSHGIMTNRVNKMTLAAATWQIAYDKLNKNIIDFYGEEAARRCRNGEEQREFTNVYTVEKGKDKGKQKEEIVVKNVINPDKIVSPFAVPLKYIKGTNMDMQYNFDYILNLEKLANLAYNASNTNTGKKLYLEWVYDQLGVSNWVTDYQRVLSHQSGWCNSNNESDDTIIYSIIYDGEGEAYVDFNAWGGLWLHEAAQQGIYVKPCISR